MGIRHIEGLEGVAGLEGLYWIGRILTRSSLRSSRDTRKLCIGTQLVVTPFIQSDAHMHISIDIYSIYMIYKSIHQSPKVEKYRFLMIFSKTRFFAKMGFWGNFIKILFDNKILIKFCNSIAFCLLIRNPI